MLRYSFVEDTYRMKGVEEPMLYTVEEVAQTVKTNVDYVYKLLRSGILPFLKIGRYKVRREALSDFLASYEGKDLSDPFHVKEVIYGES